MYSVPFVWRKPQREDPLLCPSFTLPVCLPLSKLCLSILGKEIVRYLYERKKPSPGWQLCTCILRKDGEIRGESLFHSAGDCFCQMPPNCYTVCHVKSARKAICETPCSSLGIVSLSFGKWTEMYRSGTNTAQRNKNRLKLKTMFNVMMKSCHFPAGSLELSRIGKRDLTCFMRFELLKKSKD